ncbi:hypothetical protein YC2023_071244 [Brassica napus]
MCSKKNSWHNFLKIYSMETLKMTYCRKPLILRFSLWAGPTNRVFLLRGSSETRVSAEEFGFLKETCDRYGEHGPVLHSRCIDGFKTLPLAYVLSDSVYTTHGGLFQSSSRVHEDSTLLLGSLEELDKVDMRQVGENDDGNITLNHVLWSCLWMVDGLSESNYKGLL